MKVQTRTHTKHVSNSKVYIFCGFSVWLNNSFGFYFQIDFTDQYLHFIDGNFTSGYRTIKIIHMTLLDQQFYKSEICNYRRYKNIP